MDTIICLETFGAIVTIGALVLFIPEVMPNRSGLRNNLLIPLVGFLVSFLGLVGMFLS